MRVSSFFASRRMSAIEPGTDGSQVAIELSTGLGIRHFTEIAEHDHFAVMRRQGLDGFANQIDGLAAQHIGDGVVSTLQRKFDLLSLFVLGDQRRDCGPGNDRRGGQSCAQCQARNDSTCPLDSSNLSPSSINVMKASWVMSSASRCRSAHVQSEAIHI